MAKEGYSRKGFFGETIHYDANGRKIGESRPNFWGGVDHYDANGTLVEMPIYTEMRPFWDFVSPIRIFRMVRAKFHKHKRNESATASSAQQVANKDDNRKHDQSPNL